MKHLLTPVNFSLNSAFSGIYDDLHLTRSITGHEDLLANVGAASPGFIAAILTAVGIDHDPRIIAPPFPRTVTVHCGLLLFSTESVAGISLNAIGLNHLL